MTTISHSQHLFTAEEFAALRGEGLRLESEVAEKVQMWLDAGVRLVWVARPVPRAIEVYRAGAAALTLGDGDSLDGGDVVPGFSTPVSQVFG